MKILIVVFLTFVLTANTSVAAKEKFVGTLKLIPIGCEKTAICILAEDFGYIDSKDIGWQADKGDKTDGASIPKWAQRFVGVPYTKKYLPAAVLHDQYSKSVRPVRSWLETQNMFYDALVFNGVSRSRAAVLFAGVLIGSGKWIIRMKGEKCNIGETCIKSLNNLVASIEKEPESYDKPEFKKLFYKLKTEIEASGNLTASQVEVLVRREMPDSVYLNNASGVIFENMEAWQ